MTQPTRKVHCIGQSQATNALFAFCHQRSTIQNASSKGIQHTNVLFVQSIGFYFNFGAIGLIKSALCSFAPSTFVLCQFVQYQLIILTNQLAHFHINFKTVGAGGISCGSDKYSSGTIGILQIGGHIVFYLDIMPLANVTKSVYLAGQSTNPLQQIQLMGALVQQNTAAFTCPSSTPCTGIIINLGTIPVSNNPVYTLDCSQFATVYQFMHFAI